MNQQSIQKFNEQYQAMLKERMFPAEELLHEKDNDGDSVWLNWAKIALYHASPLSLGVTGKEFSALMLLQAGNINMLQFAILSNNLERCTPKQLDIPWGVYCRIVISTGELTDKWNAMVAELRAELEKKIQEEEADKPKIHFKPVKAEA